MDPDGAYGGGSGGGLDLDAGAARDALKNPRKFNAKGRGGSAFADNERWKEEKEVRVEHDK